jgi:hypothetical protein
VTVTVAIQIQIPAMAQTEVLAVIMKATPAVVPVEAITMMMTMTSHLEGSVWSAMEQVYAVMTAIAVKALVNAISVRVKDGTQLLDWR